MSLVTPEQPIEPEKVLWLGPVSSSYSLDSSFLSPDPVTCQAPHGQKATSNACRQREILQLLAVKVEHPVVRLHQSQGKVFGPFLDLESEEEFRVC